MKLSLLLPVVLSAAAYAQGQNQNEACRELPSHGVLKSALTSAVQQGVNGGLGFHMWATLVNRDGEVCAVVFTGPNRGAQWPGSRVISAQKANTANAFSVPGFALSTANLHFATQPGGTLYGLQHGGPVDAEAAYGGNSAHYGQPNDPLVGRKMGGVNVFGGGLALYNTQGVLVGGLGVSGDTSCTDHIVAWKTRDRLGLDFVPAGPAGAGKDNIIHDLVTSVTGQTMSPSGFGHPVCDAGATGIAANLPNAAPTGNPQPLP